MSTPTLQVSRPSERIKKSAERVGSFADLKDQEPTGQSVTVCSFTPGGLWINEKGGGKLKVWLNAACSAINTRCKVNHWSWSHGC